MYIHYIAKSVGSSPFNDLYIHYMDKVLGHQLL